jgi:hypothetical protein
MKVLTQDALLLCKHGLGVVALAASQSWVTVTGRAVLVKPDPERKPIAGCPVGPPIAKPCTTTMAVDRGYSDFVRIDGKAVCLDTVTGFTDFLSPPRSVMYDVKNPAQVFVSVNA